MFSHEFRGKKRVHEDEKKRLNKLGGNILRETGLDFEEWKDHDWLKDTPTISFLAEIWSEVIIRSFRHARYH